MLVDLTEKQLQEIEMYLQYCFRNHPNKKRADQLLKILNKCRSGSQLPFDA